jgi:hypothetical protein
MKYIMLLVLLTMPLSSFSQSKKVKYKYKKFERFDFDALDVEGSTSSPGDLSIGPRIKKIFKNKIPERKNFHREMKSSIDSIL